MVGEPVLFNLEINDTGSEDVYLHAKNPSGCLDTYAFSVQRTNSAACGANWNAECGDAAFALKPGESEQAQWPLNFWYQFEGEGEYEVSVTRHVPIMSNGRGAPGFHVFFEI